MSRQPDVTAYLGLGSNLGDRFANLEKAMILLSSELKVEAKSSVYGTEPVGYTQQPRFLNAACRVCTDLSPRALLDMVKRIEVVMGRTPGFRHAPRLIDIDILLYDKLVMDTPDLVIPHPELANRAFALIPLAEIAPGIMHPVLGKSISQLMVEVSGKEGVHDCRQSLAMGRRLPMKIRSFTTADYNQVWQLWHACHIPLGTSDTQAAIEKKLERDPDLFLVADVNNAILGVVLGAWDGRTGWIYNHAVEPRCRGQGIGSALMVELEHRLAKKGATSIKLLVSRDNLDAQDFYQASGFKEDSDQLGMSKPVGRRTTRKKTSVTETARRPDVPGNR
ncbi:MAG: 2-amino-4-hydroxy-6-hydroxymethyldihydropteridine diphosphokinase [Chloroflexi bacterium]|nr:2-amino-4-hydroxy-6-hydroxymethyldihydropteridine diphosphokinase [Chloroflexota bacterium]